MMLPLILAGSLAIASTFFLCGNRRFVIEDVQTDRRREMASIDAVLYGSR